MNINKKLNIVKVIRFSFENIREHETKGIETIQCCLFYCYQSSGVSQ